MILFIRSLLFHFVFILWTLFCFIFLLWVFLLPRAAAVKVINHYFLGCGVIERVVAGLHYKVIGRENLPSGPCLIAMKHQSMYETLKIMPIFGDVAIVLKRELMRIPFWGWYQWKAGVVPVDRGAKGVALTSMLSSAKQVVATGRSIAIFPQGTRIKPFEKRPYKVGIGYLYQETHLPVVPVALNAGMFWPKRAFFVKPGTVVFQIFPPIMPGKSRDELLQELGGLLDRESDRLCEQAK